MQLAQTYIRVLNWPGDCHQLCGCDLKIVYFRGQKDLCGLYKALCVISRESNGGG